MFKHVYKAGGDWNRNGIDFHIQHVTEDVFSEYIDQGWFTSFEDLEIAVKKQRTEKAKSEAKMKPALVQVKSEPNEPDQIGDRQLNKEELQKILTKNNIAFHFNAGELKLRKLVVEHGL